MKATDHRADDAPHPDLLGDELDRLREAFCIRMRSDQVRLTSLAASLASIEGNPLGVFAALQSLAHRIRGTAAIFQAGELSSCAHALEQAATNACDSRADHADEAVWSTLEDLVERLGSEFGGDLARALPRKPTRHLIQAADEAEIGRRKMRFRQAKHR